MHHPFIVVPRAAINAFNGRGADMQAGYFAFATLLAIFPFIIFSVALAGLFIGEAQSARSVELLFDFLPGYLAETIEPVALEVLAQDHGVFTVFILLAIWAAMRAVEGLSRVFDGIYGGRETGVFLLRKGKALLVVIVGAVVSVMMGFSILLAPVIIQVIEAFSNIDIPTNITLFRYLFGTTVFYCFLWGLHWLLPNDHAVGFRRWPGVLLSTVLWVLMATGFSVYLAYAGSYSLTYGALAGIVITLLFLYFSGAILIFGAELNAALRAYEREKM